MATDWWQVLVSVSVDPAIDTDPLLAVELVADRLWASGAVAIEEQETPNGQVLLTAGYTDEAQAQASAAALDAQPGVINVALRPVHDDGLDAWRATASVVRTRHLDLVPEWLDRPSGDEPKAEGTTRMGVRLDPGRTFGSGSHPTTQLCADALVEVLDPRVTDNTEIRVLDVGTGSGVLAVVAALCGAQRVVGTDIDPASPGAVVANAQLNNVSDRVAPVAGSLAEVVASGERFQVVVANLLSPIICDLAADLVTALTNSGVLIVSGLLADRQSRALESLVAHAMVVERVDELDGWVAVRLVRHG